jgi:hypothetical protein
LAVLNSVRQAGTCPVGWSNSHNVIRENPRNANLKALYHDAADELKQKILVNRERFPAFDNVFAFLYEEIQKERSALKGKRRMISVLLHYMYCNCDIGSKHGSIELEAADADA